MPGIIVCDNCSPAKELSCPKTTVCNFSLLKQSKNSDQCSIYACEQGELLAQVGLQAEAIEGAVCDRDNQLIWKTTKGELLGRNLQATCGFPCSNCNPLTCDEMPCPPHYDCSSCAKDGEEDPIVYSMDAQECAVATCGHGQMFSRGQPATQAAKRSNKMFPSSPIVYSMDAQECAVATCAHGQMFSRGQPATQAVCANGGYLVNGQIVSQISCGLRHCKEAYCPTGVMNADGVQVNYLTCNGKGKWVDNAGTEYTSAHCEMSCELCTALSNAGMPCPTGLICEAPTERDACDICTAPPSDGLTCPDGLVCTPASIREGHCKEAYCPAGVMNADGVQVNYLTCNGKGKWVDNAGTEYTSAHCEMCQCPAASCPTGSMRAGPGNVIVTSLMCDGDAQWVDSQNSVYTSAQCEARKFVLSKISFVIS
ncbi:unnamed protein product [Strongylus vulgaris]|uniref:Uncharacterized protein n=1 Tax=Strongylus vulgaris TaxID=40348 RepID=A0A3P7JIK4_STRVU|nr:unnamed protein product [Strongylus vulgaris]